MYAPVSKVTLMLMIQSFRAGGWVTQQPQQQPAQQPPASNAWGHRQGDQVPSAPRDVPPQPANGSVAAPAPAWGAPRQAAPRQVWFIIS